MVQANIEFFIYLASALIFLGTVILISVRPLSWHRWLAGLAVGLAWLITWYAPIPIWIGAFLVLVALWSFGSTSYEHSSHRWTQ